MTSCAPQICLWPPTGCGSVTHSRPSVVVSTGCAHCFPESNSHRAAFQMVTSCELQRHLRQVGWWNKLQFLYWGWSWGSNWHLSSLSSIRHSVFPYLRPTVSWSKLLSCWSDPELQVDWPFICPVLFGSGLLYFPLTIISGHGSAETDLVNPLGFRYYPLWPHFVEGQHQLLNYINQTVNHFLACWTIGMKAPSGQVVVNFKFKETHYSHRQKCSFPGN